MQTLTCKQVRFYSQADESAFFHFAKSIKAVKRVEGVSDTILLHVSSRPSQESVHDLAARFQRYRISNEAQLQVFGNSTPQPK